MNSTVGVRLDNAKATDKGTLYKDFTVAGYAVVSADGEVLYRTGAMKDAYDWRGGDTTSTVRYLLLGNEVG